jgi:hypothetical protein
MLKAYVRTRDVTNMLIFLKGNFLVSGQTVQPEGDVRIILKQAVEE